MARVWAEGEPITVVCDERGRPLSFRWRKTSYEIEHICNRWRVHEAWWESDEAWWEYIKLATTDGLLCLIAQDLHKNSWFLMRIYD